MKKCFKFLSVLLALMFLLSSCGRVSDANVTERIKTYFDKNDYIGCKAYLLSIDSNTKNKISDECIKLSEEEFLEIYSKYENCNVFDISLFDDAFIENCNNLWQIVSEFSPNEKSSSNENLQYLRYFSEMSDSMIYRELFRMIKDMYNCGYLYSIQKALYDYDNSGEYSYFENAKEIAEKFNYSDYNPQEYYISDLRSVCERTNKYLISVTNGFATEDTDVTASAINDLYTSADSFLMAYDNVQSIYSALKEALNAFKINGAFAEYKHEIKFTEARKYTSGTEFQLSNVFGSVYIPPDENSDENDNSGEDKPIISKKAATKIAVDAINKTKSYKSDITVNKSQNVDIQMTAFETESEITSAVSLARMKINDELKKSNGIIKDSKTFSNGVSDGISLIDTVPPSKHSASLEPSFIEEYTAVEGSGGYVITFTLPACTSTDDKKSQSLFSIVDGFYLDNSAQNIEHETFYKPTYVSLVVNNLGCLSKYSYTVSGVSNCKFTENGTQVASGEFTFTQQYDYSFVY